MMIWYILVCCTKKNLATLMVTVFDVVNAFTDTLTQQLTCAVDNVDWHWFHFSDPFVYIPKKRTKSVIHNFFD
jgi:hypothetical protein